MASTWSDRLAFGAAAGTAATVPMSIVMLAAERLGLMGKQPPAKIVGAALDKIAVHPPSPARRALTVAAHLGFGAAAGALYSLVRPGHPAPARAALEGVGFGSAVWGTSYAGWVPALGIMPPPTDDRPGRPQAMLVAHWVFGAVLGALIAGTRRPRRR